jgi:2-keto-4-pentenoate hydratase/2-oxohepta-3-ene-1,7-dioic acid hydratase in catechol pathway
MLRNVRKIVAVSVCARRLCVVADGGERAQIGRNYADHAKEMNSPVPTEPFFFVKPSSS